MSNEASEEYELLSMIPAVPGTRACYSVSSKGSTGYSLVTLPVIAWGIYHVRIVAGEGDEAFIRVRKAVEAVVFPGEGGTDVWRAAEGVGVGDFHYHGVFNPQDPDPEPLTVEPGKGKKGRKATRG